MEQSPITQISIQQIKNSGWKNNLRNSHSCTKPKQTRSEMGQIMCPCWRLLGLGPKHLNKKKKLFCWKFDCFHLFCRRLHFKDLSVCTNWWCHLDHWERFLASCFIFLANESESCTFAATNKNFVTPTARGQEFCYYQSEHYALITSQFKISLMLEGKARRFEYKLTADSPLFGANFIRSA